MRPAASIRIGRLATDRFAPEAANARMSGANLERLIRKSLRDEDHRRIIEDAIGRVDRVS